MSDDLDQFRQAVGTFEKMVRAKVRGAYESRTFAWLCGSDNLLVKAIGPLARRPAPVVPGPDPEWTEPVERFRTALGELDQMIQNKHLPPPAKDDFTLPGRWSALYSLIQSRFVEKASSDFGACLKNAARVFDTVWKNANLGPNPGAPSIADCSEAKRADKGLFSDIQAHLTQPWTPGTWMVWDVLCQWNQTAKPVATETTPVLFASGAEGQVMRLVVEALPGPPGLVTPNWWQLGLATFSSHPPERRLLPAIQRVMRLAATTAGFRLRWHLETKKRRDWEVGLEGRSIEAAAVVATLALQEQHRELQEQGGETNLPAFLDNQAVVTGIVGQTDDADPCNWPLEVIDGLQTKLNAAKRECIDVVAVPDRPQQLDGIIVPEGVRVEPIATVGDAYENLLVTSKLIAKYKKEKICDAWAQRWKEEPTPEEFVRASQGDRS